MPSAPLPAPEPTVLEGEYALVAGDAEARRRLLVLPALFDEGASLRRFAVTTMRQLAARGCLALLPDLPGLNESLAPLAQQTLAGWRGFAGTLAREWRADAVLTLRGGCLVAPPGLPAIHFAPVAGAAILGRMLRAAALAEREAGRPATREALLERGRREGLCLSGHALGPAMIAALAEATLPASGACIDQASLGGAALWLRAEPGDDPAQAKRLAQQVLALLERG